jgi:chaperonin GroES
MKFEPMYDYIVIKPWITSEMSRGGILLPTDNDIIVTSEVAAVGEGHFLASGEVKPLKTKVGDKVVFNKTVAQFEVKEDGEKYYVIHERDLLGINRE